MHMKKLQLILLILLPALVSAQLLTPEAYNGYAGGTTYTVTGNHYQYYQHLAQSDRVLHNTYGKSIQNRDLIQLVISSEENLANIEKIKADNRTLTRLDGLIRGSL